MNKRDKEEIVSFFKSRGERCLKIVQLPSHQERIDDFNCLVMTPSGKRENVLICLQKSTIAAKSLQSRLSL